MADLRPGERGWLDERAVHVQHTGMVYVDPRAALYRVAGTQPWPEHQTEAEFLLDVGSEGELVLHVHERVVVRTTYVDRETLAEMYQVDWLEIHGRGEFAPCKVCGGRGFVLPPERRR